MTLFGFLKGTKRSYANNHFFQHLKEDEIALRCEYPQQQGKKPLFYFKRITRIKWKELLTASKVPFSQLAISELLLPSPKKHCCPFLLIKSKAFTVPTLLLFWNKHRFLHTFPLRAEDVSVASSEEPCFLVTITRYKVQSSYVRWIASQFRIFLKNNFTTHGIHHRLVDEEIYKKNGCIPVVGSRQIRNGTLEPTTLLTLDSISATQEGEMEIIRFSVRDCEQEHLEAFHETCDSAQVKQLLQSWLQPFAVHIVPNADIQSVTFSPEAHSIYATLRTRQCPFAKREHKKSHLRLLVSPWGILLQCWSKSRNCTSPTSKWWIPLTSTQWTQLLSFFPVQDGLHTRCFFQKYPQYETSWSIETYCNPIVKPYFDFESKYKWHLEQSAMCTQKTQQCIEWLTQNKHLSFCFICPRISFCQSVFTRLQSLTQPVLLYGTDLFHAAINRLDKTPKNVVIQYESLWQVAHLPFDVAIVDEITTVLSCVTSPTNKHRLQINSETFQGIMARAQHVLLLDADLNAKALELVHDFTKKEEEKVRFRINTYRNPELQKSVIFYMDRPKRFHPQRSLYAPKTPFSEAEVGQPGRGKFVTSLKNRLSAGQRVVIISGSINFFEQEIEPWLKEKNIGYGWYKQNSGHEEHLKDVNYFWADHGKKRSLEESQKPALQVVAFTNRITVGLSYELRDFDSIYIYGSPGSVIPRLLMQMRGRIRQLKESTIAMYIFQRSDPKVLTSWDALWSHFHLRRDVLAEFRSSPQDIEWETSWQTWRKEFEWVAKQYVYHELECNLAKANFLRETVKQLIHNGYPWIFSASFLVDTTTIMEEEKINLPFVPEYSQLFDQIQIVPLESCRSPRKSEEGKLQVIKSRLAHLLETKDSALLWRCFQVFKQKPLWRSFLHNYFAAKYPTQQEWCEEFNQGTMFQIGQEFAPKIPARFSLLHQMITLLGWKHLRDHDTVVSTRTTMQQAPIRARMRELTQQYHVIYTTKDSSVLWKNLPGMVQKVSALLKAFTGQTLVPYCRACACVSPCPQQHLKEGKAIPYRQFVTRDETQKPIKLYCFEYKMKPSPLETLIGQLISSSSNK